MRRIALLLVLLVATVGLTAAPATAAPYCGIRWGSLDKAAGQMVTSPITAVRAGRHACFDRFVVEVRGNAPGYRVHYASSVQDVAAGRTLSLRGRAFLAVDVRAPAYDANGRGTYTPANPAEVVNVSGYRTLRQVAWGGSFEGHTVFGIGVRARLPFRVFRLSGPGSSSRLVIDVAHRWTQ